MIIIMGYIYVNPPDVTEFLTDVARISAETRAEEGCLFYVVTLDDATTGRMLVAERWQDQAALTAHLQGKQVAAFQRWESKITIDVLRYDASNERPLLP